MIDRTFKGQQVAEMTSKGLHPSSSSSSGDCWGAAGALVDLVPATEEGVAALVLDRVGRAGVEAMI